MRTLIPVTLLALSVGGVACAGSRTSPEPVEPVQIGPMIRPGIPADLAQHRAATLRDVSYDLALDLNGNAEWINGSVTISVERLPGASHLVLDFRGLAVAELFANGEPVPDRLEVNEHIIVPERYLVPGRNAVDIRFTSAVAASGASVIRLEEPAGPSESAGGAEGRDVYYYTLLVPADASQLFPAFDQPDLKAHLRLELIAPSGVTVLSNGSIESQMEVAVGLWTRFAPTVPLSTYLFAFAAGPWETWTDGEARVPMILHARRSRAAEVDHAALFDVHRRGLHWLEQYFDYAYPFGKLDLLLAPAFPFGGMEHPGAIFYNESRFVFREPPTLDERLSRDATIFHELAHQWFGDLVTMRWFDDLWLKEGFATYLAARMQEALEPGSGAWKTFYLRNKPGAYRVDLTSGTTPLWQALDNLDAAKSNYGPIVYNKGPAVLKQLNHLVGEEDFRRAIRRLLRRHEFGNFTWRDLLAEMEGASGIPMENFGEQYILGGGVPVIETELSVRDGVITELALVQRSPTGEAGRWWPGLVQLRLGYSGGEDVILPVRFDGVATPVGAAVGLPAPDYIFPNDEDYGYGIFLLDAASAAYLLDAAAELSDPLLRTLVWGSLWDGVRDGRVEPEDLIRSAMQALPGEADPQIAGFLRGRVSEALRAYLPRTDAPHPLQQEFERLLARGIEVSADSYDLRRGRLDALLSIASTGESLRLVEQLLAEDRTFNGEPLTQPARWAAVRTLIAEGHASPDSLIAAEQRRDPTPEGEREAFISGAARPDSAGKAVYFARFEDPELNEEWVTAALPAFNHPAHEEVTLRYLEEALRRLPWIREHRRIFFLPQWIDSFVAAHRGADALAIVDAHLAAATELPEDVRRKILQARDELARSIAIREGR